MPYRDLGWSTIAVLALIVIGPSILPAQVCEPRVVTILGGEARDVQVRDNLAYVVHSSAWGLPGRSSLYIYDVSDPGEGVLVGAANNLFAQAHSLVLHESAAYVIADDLIVVDISDPSSPSVATVVDLRNGRDAARAGNHLYVAAQATLHIFDVTDPLVPILLSQWKMSGDCYAVDIVDSILYAGMWRSVEAIDVSDPADPQLLGSYSIADQTENLTVSGNRLYFAGRFEGMKIIDVSDPAVMSVIGQYSTPVRTQSIEVRGTIAYVVDFTGVQMLDVTDATDPRPLGWLPLPHEGRKLDVVGDTVFIAATEMGMVISDAKDPSAPAWVRSYAVPNVPRGVTVADGIAYVSDSYAGLHLIDLEHPHLPQPRSLVPTNSSRNSFVEGGIAYVADGNGLKTIDVSDPARPTVLGGWTGAPAFHIAVADGIAYVGSQHAGLRTYDVADPARILPLGAWYSPEQEFAEGVAVSSGVAYVAFGHLGFASFDVSDPSSPELIDVYDGLGRPNAVDLVGDVAYVVDGQLRIFDVSDPASLRLVGGGAVGSADIVVQGGVAAVTGSGYLRLVDVREPSSPAVIGEYRRILEGAEGVARYGDYVLVAAPKHGLFIFDISACLCIADCDNNGELDFFDFLCFQNEFAAQTPYADCDGSGSHDFFDFLCFQNAFAAGCD